MLQTFKRLLKTGKHHFRRLLNRKGTKFLSSPLCFHLLFIPLQLLPFARHKHQEEAVQQLWVTTEGLLGKSQLVSPKQAYYPSLSGSRIPRMSELNENWCLTPLCLLPQRGWVGKQNPQGENNHNFTLSKQACGDIELLKYVPYP